MKEKPWMGPEQWGVELWLSQWCSGFEGRIKEVEKSGPPDVTPCFYAPSGIIFWRLDCVQLYS